MGGGADAPLPAMREGRGVPGLSQVPRHCRACSADFRAADAGDGPAVFVILIVGAIVAPLLFILQFGARLPGLAGARRITMLAAVALCLAFLPPFKSVLFALQWKHKAREATLEDIE